MKTYAYAALEQGSTLVPYTLERRELRHDER